MNATTAPTPNRFSRLERVNLKWLPIVFGLLGCGIFFLSTHNGGIATTADSVNFIAASRSLLVGDSYRRFSGELFWGWPPLYPTIIAGLNLLIRVVPMDIVEAIRILHALAYGGVICLAGLLYLRCIRSKTWALMGMIAMMCGFSLLRIAVFAWTEIIYIFLSLLFFLYLPKFLEERKPGQLLLLTLIATFGPLQRFAGLGLIPAGALCIFLFSQHVSLIRRLVNAAFFCVSLAPYALWIVFVYTIRPPGSVGIQENPARALQIALQYNAVVVKELFLPEPIGSEAGGYIIMAAIVMVIGLALWNYFRPGINSAPLSPRTSPAPLAVYVLVYYNATIFTVNGAVDHRHFSVLYVYVVLLLFAALERLSHWLRPRRLDGILIAVTAIWLLHPISALYRETAAYASTCCDGGKYRNLSLIRWLNDHPLAGHIYSNTPYPLFNTPLQLYTAPRSLDDWSQVLAKHDAYFIWFANADQYSDITRFYFNPRYTEAELSSVAQLEIIAAGDDGKIYHLRRLTTDVATQ
jgi:hypothetical protein